MSVGFFCVWIVSMTLDVSLLWTKRNTEKSTTTPYVRSVCCPRQTFVGFYPFRAVHVVSMLTIAVSPIRTLVAHASLSSRVVRTLKTYPTTAVSPLHCARQMIDCRKYQACRGAPGYMSVETTLHSIKLLFSVHHYLFDVAATIGQARRKE